MDPFMLTSVTLLAQREGWQQPERAPRRARLAPLRAHAAAALRALAIRVEPAPAREPLRSVAAP